jgi:hypothetical protein
MAYPHSTPETPLSPTEKQTMPRPSSATPNGVASQSTRKRKSTENSAPMSDPTLHDLYSAATDEEKNAWQGFCEIESDPVSQAPPILNRF